jgi:valyl-tRNA synthetase
VLGKRVAKVDAGLEALRLKLANEAFTQRADPGVVEEERARFGEMDLELQLLKRNLAGF